MKNFKKIVAIVMMMAVIMTLLIVPSIAATTKDEGTVMPYATGAKINMLSPVLDQSVAEVNKTIKNKTEDFVIEGVYWIENYPLPTVVSKDQVVGRIHMEKNGLESDKGEPISCMKDGDTFKWDTKYLLVFNITNKKYVMDESSEIKLNGKRMVYEGFGDEEKSGRYLLFAEQFMACAKETPNAVFEATGASTGTLYNVDSSMQYSKDGGATWVECSNEEMKLDGVVEGFLYVRYAQDDQNVQKIYVTRESVPEGVGGVACKTADNKDGSIKGVDTSMEYRGEKDAEYTKVIGKEVTGLKAGIYFVRRAANGNSLASSDATVIVPEYKAAVPVVEEQPKSVTVDTGKDAKITIKVKGDNLKYEWHYIDAKTNKDTTINKKEEADYFDGQGTNTLTIKSVNKLKNKEFDCEYNGDKYFCVVSNEAGKIISNIVTYTVNHVPSEKWEKDSTSHWKVCVCGKILNKGTHVDTNKDGKCDACKFDMSNFRKFNIIFGDAGIWEPGTAEPYRVIADADYTTFKELRIDGKKVNSIYYTVSKGSTIVDIKPEFMDKLSNNTHVITLKFADGSVSTDVTIASNDHKDIQPVEINVWVYVLIGIGVLVLAAIIVCIVLLAKRNKK